MAALRLCERGATCVVAFVYNLVDILHYYRCSEEVLRLRQQWHDRGRCPRQFYCFGLFVATFWLRAFMHPCLFVFVSVDTTTKVILGDFVYFFRVHFLYLIVFAISVPVPVYYLLFYPYLNSTTDHYDSFMFPKTELARQLALPAKSRDPYFQSMYVFFISLFLMFGSLLTIFFVMITVHATGCVLEKATFFFGSVFGGLCLVLAVVNTVHVYCCYLSLFHILRDMFTSIYYFSICTFRDLRKAEALLQQQQQRKFRYLDAEQFRHEHTRILTRVFHINTIVGNNLLLLYLTNYPTNAFLVYHVLTPKLSLLLKCMLAAYMINQLAFMVAVHLLAALYRVRLSCKIAVCQS